MPFVARLAVSLLALITASCASRYAIVRENGRVVEQAWRQVTYAWGSVDSADTDPCSFASNVTSAYGIEVRIRGDAFVLSVPQTRHARFADGRLTWLTCAPSERAIPANTIVRLAYQRTTRTAPQSAAFDVASAAIGLLVDAIRPNRIDRHFLSVDFRDASGGVASATIYLEGDGADRLVPSLARLSPVAIVTSADSADALPVDTARTISVDPIGQLLPAVPVWPADDVPLSGAAGLQAAPTGAVVLAGGALWDVDSGTRIVRLPDGAGESRVSAFTPNGRTLLLGRNSGNWNSRNAPRAGRLLGLGVPDGTERFRLENLPWLERMAVGPDGNHLAAVHSLPSAISIVSLERASVIWRSPLPAERPGDVRGVDVSADAVLTFGRDWAIVWQLVDGTSVFNLESTLRQLSTDDGPPSVVDAWLLGEPQRLLMVFAAGAARHAAVIDLSTSRLIHRARLAETRALSTALSPDRSTLFVGTAEQSMLWDTSALTVAARFERQPSGGRLAWGAFDETGEYVATAVRYPEGLSHHVVVWHVRTGTAVGQCLAASAIDIVLGRSGRAVLAGGYDRPGLTRCRPPSAGALRQGAGIRER